MSGRFSRHEQPVPDPHRDDEAPEQRGLVVDDVRPGVIPWMMNAPNIRAMTGWAGRPSVRSGMNEVWAAALFADSGPATPSIAPWPNDLRDPGRPASRWCRRRTRRARARAREDPEGGSEGRPAKDWPAMRRRSSRVGTGCPPCDEHGPPALVLEVPEDLGDPEHAHGDRDEVDARIQLTDAERVPRACPRRGPGRRSRAGARGRSWPAP